MPIFSIIVPVYKTEDYLYTCVDSILNQTFSDFELILVDDGSPDNCLHICDCYAAEDARVSVIHKENGGVSSARNAGIDAATGDYIWFVDSDDYIEDFSLEQIYDAMQENNADLYLFNTNSRKELFTGGFEEFLYRYYFTYVVGFGPWNKIYRRKLLIENDLRFDIEETVGEDLLFNLNYYYLLFGGGNKGKLFFFLGRDYYHYVDRVGSAMNSTSKNRLKQQLRLFNKIALLLGDGVNSAVIRYFYVLHLISGINQSKPAGLTAQEFADEISFTNYSKYNIFPKKERRLFFVNENASSLGRIRMTLFFALMKSAKYRAAGRIMGLA